MALLGVVADMLDLINILVRELSKYEDTDQYAKRSEEIRERIKEIR